LAEHFLGKEEVIGSSPIVGSIPADNPALIKKNDAAKPRL
jgi:hypothetical protein